MVECNSLFLVECNNCPNLKILKCKHRNQYISKVREEMRNGGRVEEDITDEELDGKKVVREWKRVLVNLLE